MFAEKVRELKRMLSTDRAKKVMTYTLLILIICGLAYLRFMQLQRDNAVVPESQVQAETPAGVEQAASQAGVKLEHSQAKEAAKEIRYIYETKKEPVYVVNTTGEKAPAAASAARKQAKADFAIITDKNNPDKEVKLEELAKEQPVELNQYNVQAYKPVIRTISIAPDINERGVRQVNFSISKKITKDGQYVGVGVGYDIVDKRALVNLSYSW